MRSCVVGLAGIVVLVSVVPWLQEALSQTPDTPRDRKETADQQPPDQFRLPVPPLLEALDSNHDGELQPEELKDAGASPERARQEQRRPIGRR